MTLRRVEILVVGRVQGVCYRASTQEQAQGLGLVGTVQNLADGSVRVIAEGAETDLQSLLAWCRRGPAHARVDTLTPVFSEATGAFSAFRILR